MNVQAITPERRGAINAFIAERWLSTDMIIRGEVIDMTAVDGFLVTQDGAIVALVTYLIRNGICEITSLDSLIERRGIGSALVHTVVEVARGQRCRKVIVVTTNDHIDAIRFYQKRGFDMARLYHNALNRSRELKPSIPITGNEGIPLMHEIEFEMIL
ncbi:MAG: GNAT family N-acetyltransferase [Anaerolineae bacterium]